MREPHYHYYPRREPFQLDWDNREEELMDAQKQPLSFDIEASKTGVYYTKEAKTEEEAKQECQQYAGFQPAIIENLRIIPWDDPKFGCYRTEQDYLNQF